MKTQILNFIGTLGILWILAPNNVWATSSVPSELKIPVQPEFFYEMPTQFDNRSSKKSKSRTIYFLDTKELQLYKQHHVALRIRITSKPEGEEVETVVKAMSLSEAKMHELMKTYANQNQHSVECEWDDIWKTGRYGSCTLKRKVMLQSPKIEFGQHFSELQQRYLRQMVPSDANIDVPQLQVYGPIQSTRWKYKMKKASTEDPFEKFTLEKWAIPLKGQAQTAQFFEISLELNDPQTEKKAVHFFEGVLKNPSFFSKEQSQSKTQWALEKFYLEPAPK